MVYALYYRNRLVYKRAVSDLEHFKAAVYNQKSRLFASVNYKNRSGNFNKLFNKRFESIIDGWEIRQYKNYKQVLQNVSSNKINTRRKKSEAENYFYVFDIETTNYKNKYAFSYLYGIRKYNYNYELNDDNLEQYAENYIALYGKNAVKQLFNLFNDINQTSAKDGKLTYIYAHNLNYDLFELIQNIFPLFELTDEDVATTINDSIFRGSAVKPLRFRFKNLVFVDSLALINKSLAKVSQSHKIKKLVENKTYKEQYFFGSELPASELEYNKHDLDVTALGIADSIRSLKQPFKTFNDYIKCNVSTITGISKYLNKHIYKDYNDNRKNINEHVARASHNLPLTDKYKIDTERLLFRQNTFQGGYTHANPFIAYNANQSDDYVYISYDKKSHYPSTMTMRYFPYDFKVIDEDKTETLKYYVAENLKRIEADSYNDFKFNMINDSNKVKDRKIYNNYFAPTSFRFITEVELRNVQIKIYNGCNCMPLIAMSKTTFKAGDYFRKDLIVDNGKLLKADKVTLRCTDIDMLSYSLMYEFEISNCTYLESTTKTKWADGYIQSTLRYHLVNKNELSLLKEKKKKINELTDFTGAAMYNDNLIETFNTFSAEEKKSFINNEIQNVKQSGVNNQYGINVQRIINDNITFDLSQYRFQKEKDVIQGCNGIQTSRDYITGMYITAFARLDLAYMTYIIYNELESATVCYWDTDSIKVKVRKSEREKLDALFSEYNEKIEIIRAQSEKLFGGLFNLGIWEFDGEYKYFYTMGAKKYVTAADGKIAVTNAGINKKKMSSFLTEEYKKLCKEYSEREAFEKLVSSYYHPNVTLGTDITGRKTITYPDIKCKKIKLEAVDENGDKIKINQRPTALIVDCDYSLSNTRGKSLINRQHFQLCRRLQLNNGYDFNCNINNNFIGRKTGILTDDKSDYII